MEGEGGGDEIVGESGNLSGAQPDDRQQPAQGHTLAEPPHHPSGVTAEQLGGGQQARLAKRYQAHQVGHLGAQVAA